MNRGGPIQVPERNVLAVEAGHETDGVEGRAQGQVVGGGHGPEDGKGRDHDPIGRIFYNS